MIPTTSQTKMVSKCCLNHSDRVPHAEIEEYAEWLGMDLDRDKSLFWIAREGIKAQLPPSWKPCKAPVTPALHTRAC